MTLDEQWNILTSELFTLTADPGLPWIPGRPDSPLLPLKDNIQKVTPQSHMVTSSYHRLDPHFSDPQLQSEIQPNNPSIAFQD